VGLHLCLLQEGRGPAGSAWCCMRRREVITAKHSASPVATLFVNFNDIGAKRDGCWLHRWAAASKEVLG
jgi:hypothetical protein